LKRNAKLRGAETMKLYSKRENNEFKQLLAEAQYLLEHKKELNYSETFPPEIAAALTGAAGVTAIFLAFKGLSGAAIMSTLKGIGIVGAVKGITTVAASPLALATGVYIGASQLKEKRITKELLLKSYEIEEELNEDPRKIVVNLLKGIIEYREQIITKHPKLRRKEENNYS